MNIIETIFTADPDACVDIRLTRDGSAMSVCTVQQLRAAIEEYARSDKDSTVTFCKRCGHADVSHDDRVGCKGSRCLCVEFKL